MAALAARRARFGRAVEMFLRIFGPDYGAELTKQIDEGPTDFNAILMERISPVIWGLNRVDLRTKLFCTLAVFTALNRDDLKYFARAALHHGISREEMEEVILLAGLESGFPAATAARRRLNDAIAEHAAFMAARRQPRAGARRKARRRG
jgi:alkylhydroperoxidase/carboxymuconolactone decarboxylase family protein YurZ